MLSIQKITLRNLRVPGTISFNAFTDLLDEKIFVLAVLDIIILISLLIFFKLCLYYVPIWYLNEREVVGGSVRLSHGLTGTSGYADAFAVKSCPVSCRSQS